MFFALCMVSGISIYQELRSEKALRALKSLTDPAVRVVREGREVTIRCEEVVVGDIVRISEGDRIPADAVTLQANDLTVDESMLTGESLPVVKDSVQLPVFAGTYVLAGAAILRITAVGPSSRIGSIGVSVKAQKNIRTQLQQQVRRFVRWMAISGVGAFIFVWIYHYLDTRDVMHSLFHGLTLAMAVIPEEIPVAVSTFMALGAYRMFRKNVLVRHPQTVEALGSATVICVDKTGTITQNKMTIAAIYDATSDVLIDQANGFGPLKILLNRALLASEPEVFDPMEKAIESVAHAEGVFRDGFQVVLEYPLSGKFPMMTHVYRDPNHQVIAAVKGAPEGILLNSTLDFEGRSRIQKKVTELATKGFRVLAVADSFWPDIESLPESQQAFQWNFMGLLAFSDPVKNNIPEVLCEFREAGIDVKMITGDFPLTACHIAAVAGFPHPNHFLTGEQVNAMTENELRVAVAEVDVFARSMPETKLKLIKALKDRGEVVAMTGDGVNDAPALKAAHIGIAMGKRGSEVARQSASLVLLDDDLSGMVEAVKAGRKIYANLKKAIRYIISIHLPILAVVVIPLVLGWKYIQLFTPVHVIFLELVMGPTCSVVFENEPVDPGLMKRRPRKFSVAFFTWRELSFSLLQGGVIAVAVLVAAHHYMVNGSTELEVRTVTFVTLVFCNVFLTLSGRSTEQGVWVTLLRHNALIPWVLSITFLFLGLFLTIIPIQSALGFTSLDFRTVIVLFIWAAVAVFWREPLKKSDLTP